jgi:hypothetical protein
MSRLLTVATLLFALAGCSNSSEDSELAGGGPPGTLTAVDLERFLAVVQNHEGAMIPEFTPPDEDPSFNFDGSAQELVTSFQAQCQRLFDVDRQGSIWQRDTEWAQALAGNKISPSRFAALVRDVSLAIMRVRLEARVDLDRLVSRAKRQVERAITTMDEIDEVPAEERTEEATTQRTRNVIQLGRSVALLEFAELVRQVPPESAAVVRRYSRQLKPLLPAGINDELLAELKQLATAPESNVQSAAYEERGRK